MVPDPQVGALGRLAGAAHRHRVLVVVLWLVAVAGAVGLSQVASGDFKADYTARGSDSRASSEFLRIAWLSRRSTQRSNCASWSSGAIRISVSLWFVIVRRALPSSQNGGSKARSQPALRL